MHLVNCSIAALAVASIFYMWRAYATDRVKREQTLRERIAYMLWVMANQAR